MLPESMAWGPARGKLLDPEVEVKDPRRTTRAVYLEESIPVASGDQQTDLTQPQTCFLNVCWVHMRGSQLLSVWLEVKRWIQKKGSSQLGGGMLKKTSTGKRADMLWKRPAFLFKKPLGLIFFNLIH